MEPELNHRSPRSKLVLVKALGVDARRLGQSGARSEGNDFTDSTADLEARIDGGPDPFRRCQDGERTAHLLRLLGKWYRRGKPHGEVLLLARGWNARNLEPLSDEKVMAMCASMLRTHERNHPATTDEPAVVAPLFDLEEARVDRFLNCDPPPREWLLVDCLPLGKVGLLVAPGGTGKSQLALQLAVAVATGGMLADWWQVGEKGPVLALFAEEDDDELHRRVSAILQGRAFTPEQDTDLRKNLFIRSMTASDNLMTKAEAGSVTRTPFAKCLCATVEELSDLKLIIIDPVSRFRGGNENYAEDATRFVEAAELIAKKTGATVLLLHHVNKTSTHAGEQAQGASRGSSALTDGVRFQMNLATLTAAQMEDLGIGKDSKREYVAAKVTKSNYAPAGGTVYLRRGDHGVLTFHEPRPAQSAARTDRIAHLVGLVRDDAAKGHGYSKSSLAKRYGSPEGPFKMGINRLEKLIDDAIVEGFLTQGPPPLRSLQVTAKPTEIPKAKVVLPAMSTEAHEAAHGPENREKSKP